MDLLTTKEAAQELGVNASRIRQLILSGAIKAEKAGRDWLIDRKELEQARDRAKPGRPLKGGDEPAQPKRPRGRPAKLK